MPLRPPYSSSARSSASANVLEPQDNTRQRLIAAAAALIAEGGIAAASARAIAAQAGSSASAINYNFGNIERLLLTVFEQGVEETRVWLASRTREIAALPRTADGAVWALTHVILAWTSQGRSRALVYQEALAANAGQGAAAAWTRLWQDFWTETAALFGLDPIDGRMMHVLFESEALYHLSTWSPALEAAALTEMVEHFASIWLDTPPRAPWGAAALAAEAAGARPYNSVPPAALRIAKAAAEVVEEKGLTGLTHRAVATRAGVTTGSVTHHFRSIEDLVAGAIRGQVQLMTEQVRAQSNPPPSVDEIQTVEQYFEALRHHVASGAPPSPVLRRRRLFLAAVRREDLAASGAVIRFSQGGTTRDTLERIFSLPESDLVLHASVVSRLLSAIWFACAGDAEPARARTAVFDRIETRLRARLTPPGTEGAGGG